ncbi:hypothetical protein ACXDSS_004501 [Klebsiella quasipneumoniae]
MDNLRGIYRVISSQLASWRYFLLMALPPLFIAALCPVSWVRFSVGLALMLLGYYCWRMFLDEKLFALLSEGVNISDVDRGVALLWKKEGSEKREWQSRIQGTGKLVQRAGILLLIVWVMALSAMWFNKS